MVPEVKRLDRLVPQIKHTTRFCRSFNTSQRDGVYSRAFAVLFGFSNVVRHVLAVKGGVGKTKKAAKKPGAVISCNIWELNTGYTYFQKLRIEDALASEQFFCGFRLYGIQRDMVICCAPLGVVLECRSYLVS